MTTTWLKTEHGDWINAAHVVKLCIKPGLEGAYMSDGKIYDLDADEVYRMVGHIIPAAPGHRLYFLGEGWISPLGETVIAWAICPLFSNITPTPVGDLSGIVSDECYAIERPDGSWVIPQDDGHYQDRAAIDAHLANRSARKRP